MLCDKLCTIRISITIIAICLICLFLLTLYIIYSNNKHKKAMEELSKYSIHTSATIDLSIPEILNIIIQDAFNDYKIKSLLPLEEGFINSTREDKIRKDLVDLVSSRISNAALDKLSLFYNLQNIAAIMADKIYIVVMEYVIDHNRAFSNIDK